MADITTHSRSQQQPAKPYKVVFEAVTEEKKRLRTVESYSTRAPDGYTFVEVGSREITDQCKEISRKEGFQVYTVSNVKPRNVDHLDKLFYHNNRIGHHFRTDVLERVLGMLGRPFRHRFHNPSAFARLDSGGAGQPLGGPGAAQAKTERERQVRDAIKELFPRIPATDMEEIMTRAFAEGTGLVGDAEWLPLSKRVQLAVGAHIRHVYTAYDQLLRIVNRSDARNLIEDDCLTMLVAWRGEDQAYDEGFEEIFREVIILEDDDTLQAKQQETEHHSDVEIVSTKQFPTIPNSSILTRPGEADDRNPLFKSQQGQGTVVHVQPTRPVRNANETMSEAMQRKWKAAKNRPRQPEPARRDKSIIIDLTAATPQVRRIRIDGDEFEIHPVQDSNSTPEHTHYAMSQVKKLPPAFVGPDGVRFYEVPDPSTPSVSTRPESGQLQSTSELKSGKRRASITLDSNDELGHSSNQTALPHPANQLRFFEKPDASQPGKATEFRSIGLYNSNAGRKRKSMPNMPTGHDAFEGDDGNTTSNPRPQKRLKKSPRQPPQPAQQTVRRTRSYIDTVEELASRQPEPLPSSTTSIAVRRGIQGSVNSANANSLPAMYQPTQQALHTPRQAQPTGLFMQQPSSHTGGPGTYFGASSNLPQVDLVKLLAQIHQPQT